MRPMRRHTFKRVVALAAVTCVAAIGVPASGASIFGPTPTIIGSPLAEVIVSAGPVTVLP